MKKLEEVKTLISNAKVLENHKSSYDEKIAQPNCDKYARKFNGDTRFAVFSVKATLCCDVGYSGSSACSTHGKVNNDIAQQSFTRFLNINMDKIINWMAADIKAQAIKLTDEAKAEIESQLKFIEGLKND